MKKIIFSILLFFMGISVFAQINFEGTIKYSVKYNTKEIATITAKIKYPYIKINAYDYKVTNDSMTAINEKIILVDYDKGKIFTIDDSNEITDQENLDENKYPQFGFAGIKQDTSLHKIFGGKIFANGFIPIQGTISYTDNTKIWYAKDYYFDIPEKYTKYDKSIFFTNGRNICLGMEDNKGTWLATDILPMQIPDKEFIVSNPAFQQTNFEGTIKYSIKWNGKETQTVKATLKYPYIKINNHEHADNMDGKMITESEKIILVDYAKGKSFEIVDSIKAVKEGDLNQRNSIEPVNFEKDPSLNKRFGGNISGIGYIQNLNEAPGGILSVKNMKYWVAKELFFLIPEEHVNYMPFDPASLIINNKNICLGVEINFAKEYETYEMTVTEVLPGPVDNNTLKIPVDYKIMSVDEFCDYTDSLRKSKDKAIDISE